MLGLQFRAELFERSQFGVREGGLLLKRFVLLLESGYSVLQIQNSLFAVHDFPGEPLVLIFSLQMLMLHDTAIFSFVLHQHQDLFLVASF
jgi:hypothetical protein